VEGSVLSADAAPAAATDAAMIQELLRHAGLPLDGLTTQFPGAYVVVRDGPRLIAAAGLETYGSVGLLRSLVVAEPARNRGLGRLLVENRLARARESRLERVFVLTTSAARYFEALGFRAVARAEAPAELAACAEFAGACPASAACLARAP
jgi:N-acetylglutamate synthase-like GNAT family acetyltransferase